MGWWEKQPLRIVEISDCFDFGQITLREEVEAAALGEGR